MSALRPPRRPDYSKPPDAEDPELANWLMKPTSFKAHGDHSAGLAMPLTDLIQADGLLARYKKRQPRENERLIDALDWPRMMRDLADAIERGKA